MSRPGNAWRKVHGRITGRPTNFSWVIDGKLAGSGMPTGSGEVGWAAEQGIGAIVTMTEEPLPAGWVRDVEYLHVPTPDLEAPRPDQIDEAVGFVRAQVDGGRAVMVHCAAGLGRAGTILACYLVRYEGVAAADAIARIRAARPGSIQSAAQEAAVKSYGTR